MRARCTLFLWTWLCLFGTFQIGFSQPTSWESRGIGGGGAMFSPSFNPDDKSVMFITSDMGGLYRTTNSGESWELIHSDEIVVNPESKAQFTDDPDILYCIDGNGWQTFPSKSTDGGTTWDILSGDPTFGETYYLYADPNDNERLLLTSYTNLYFSNDGGDNFTLVYNAPDLYIGGVYWNGSEIFVGCRTGMVVSTDNGANFDLEPASGDLPADFGFLSFTGATEGGTTRLFGTARGNWHMWPDMSPYEYWGDQKIYRLDWGGVWEEVTPVFSPAAFPFFVSMAHNDIDNVYTAGADEWPAFPMIYKSSDGGDDWENVFLTVNNVNISTGWQGTGGDHNWWWGGNAMGFTVATNDSDYALITDLGFAHMTTDGGTTWSQVYVESAYENPPGDIDNQNQEYAGSGLEVTSCWWMTWFDENEMFASFSDFTGVASHDGGETWALDYTGNDFNSTTHMIEDPNTGYFYASTSTIHDIYQSNILTDNPIDNGDGEILYSVNGGSHWQTLHDFNHPVMWMALDPDNPERMYASVVHSVNGDIYRTDNLSAGSASTWVKLTSPPRTEGHPFNIHVLDDGSLVCTYSARIDGSWAFTLSSGVFISDDGGSTWEDRTPPEMLRWTKDLTIDPNDPDQDTWYAGVFSHWGAYPNEVGGLYKTTDRGLNWTEVDDLYRVEGCYFDPANPTEAYITTESEGLYFSTDLSTGSPSMSHLPDYPFWHPTRVFFNPYVAGEVWIMSYGNGMRVGNTGGGPPPPPPSLTVTVSGTPVTCFGGNDGSATASVSGGTPPYSYEWSNGETTQTIFGLTAGTYTVTVTDNVGTTGTASQIITQPPALVVSTSTTPTSCGMNNGTASAFVSGGTPPYTYFWSNGETSQTIFDLPAGTYVVIVTDGNGCSQVANAVVESEGGVSVTTTGIDVSCFGGSDGEATAHPTGGSGNYTYFWSNLATTQTISGLSAGIYTVTVTDVNTECTAIGTQIISEPSEIMVTTSSVSATCGSNNGSASADVSGGNAPYDYIWSNGGTTQTIVNLSPGTYTVTVSDDDGCTQTADAIVDAIGGISVTTLALHVSCFGGMDGEITAFPSGGSGDYSYEWSNFEYTQTILDLGIGTYHVTVTDNDSGCTATASETITQPDALNLTIVGTDAQNGNDGSADLTVFGGTMPYDYLWSNGETTEDIYGLTPGTYSVTVTDDNFCTETESVVIGGGGGGGCTWTPLDSEDFESGWGIWNDGGSDCRRSINDAMYAYSGDYCVRLRDNDPISSFMTTDNQDFSAYDELKVEFTYYVRSFDNSNEDFWLQISTNGGSTFTTVEDWVLGTDFENDERKFDEITIPGPFTANTQLRFRCDASGNSDWVYFDDVIISGCSGGGTSQYTLTTMAVGDGMIDPSGGTYDEGTPVTLTATPDSGWQFDNWSGDASGSSNPITIIMDANKTVTANFSLIGGGCTYYDINDEDFESGWGIWNDGGSDCRKNIKDSDYAHSGDYCVRLRDNDPNSSFMTTDNLDLEIYEELTIDFGYYVRSFDNSNEDFWLQISTNSGTDFTTVEDWVLGTDFENDEFKTGEAVITGPFTANTQLRFRCDASGNSDWVYLDDVVVTGCSSTPPVPIVGNSPSDYEIKTGNSTESREFVLESSKPERLPKLNLFPNPASDYLTIAFEIPDKESGTIVLSDLSGKIIYQIETPDDSNSVKIDLNEFGNGYYLVQMTGEKYRVTEKFVVAR